MIETRPKIVILIDWYLPGTKAGGPVRSAFSLVNLLKNHFNFFIITSNTDLGSTQPYKDIESDTLFQKDGVNYYYCSSSSAKTPNILRLINNIEPALVYANSFWSYQFSIGIVRAKKSGKLNVPLLLAPRGMLSSGALGLKSLKKNIFLFVSHFFGWHKSLPFHATNEQEKSDILKQFPHAKVSVAPNVNSAVPRRTKKEKKPQELKLYFLSRIARVKNLHFALQVLSRLPENINLTYHVYGNIEDAAYWEECQVLIRQLPSNINVIYKGELSFYEIQDTIAQYHALFLPTLNENFGHSIVESLFSSCPVIISDQTPWNDVEAYGAGYAISLSDNQKFQNAILALAAATQSEYDKKSEASINYISNKLNLNAIADQYKKLFDAAIKN